MSGGSERVYISLVVPIRNEERHLPACLASLVTQDYDPSRYEILVVDGESADRTAEIASEVALHYPQVRLLTNPRRTVSCGRNVGIRNARGEAIGFVEGHARVGPRFVELIARAFETTDALCLGRTVEQYLPEGNAVQQATGLLRKSRLGRNPHSLRFSEARNHFVDPLSVATVYRRRVFDQVGVFDETLTTNEDVELNWRVQLAGIKALHVAGLTYSLQPRETIGGFLRQMFRYGYRKALLVRRHPRAFRVAYAIPSGLLLLSIAGAILPPARLCLAPLAVYLVLSCLAALRPSDGGGRRYPGTRLLLSMLLVLGFGTGFAVGAVGRNSMAKPGARHGGPHPSPVALPRPDEAVRLATWPPSGRQAERRDADADHGTTRPAR